MSLLSEIDALYQQCVTEPDRCGEQFFADWADGVAANDHLDRDSARSIRRCITAARKLASFWQDRDASATEDWRSRVDIALGPRAWRPQLELAEHLLDSTGSEEAFSYVRTLFPVVRNQPFLDGQGYDAWLEARRKS